MAKNSRKIGKQGLKDLQRLESLLESTKQDNKADLIQKAKETQQALKEANPVQYLNYSHKQIKVSDVEISQHAYERSIERFSLQHKKWDDVKRYLHKHLTDADYIGRIQCTDGNEGEMFVKNQFCFHLKPESFDTIITVIKIDKMKYSPAQTKIRNLVAKEFRKLNRREKARVRQLQEYKLEADLEVSKLKLRKYRTKSDSVKLSCDARIKAITLRLDELEKEIESLADMKRQTAYALATVL